MLLLVIFQNDIKDSWSPSKVVPNRHPQRRIKRPHLAKKPSTRPSSNKISEASSEDDSRTTRRTAPKIKKNRRRKISTSTTTATPKSTKTVEPHEEATKNHRPYLIDFIEDVEAVVGLVPPSSYQYKTIVSPEEDSDSKGSNRVSQQVIMQYVILNHFFILNQHSRCMIIVTAYPKL